MHRIVVVGLVSVLSFAATASAQSTSAEAEKLFRDGKRLMAEGKIAEACDAFDGSFRKDPVASTLLNLANCREKNLQYATAWGHFVEAARLSADQPALKQSAQERAARLESRLSYLIINVPDEARIEGLTITRNGKPVDVAEWNRDMPVDGGSYTVAGKAPAFEAWSTTVEVGQSGDKQSVNVPRFREATRPSPEVVPPEVAEQPPGSSFTGRRKLAVGSWAAGAIGLGAGLALELSAQGTYDDAKASTDNTERQDLYDSANRQRLVATVVAGAGVALVATGVVLWITGKPPRREAIVVVPVVGDRATGLSLSGRL